MNKIILVCLLIDATLTTANPLQPEAVTNQPLVNEQNKKQPISLKLEPQKVESRKIQQLKTELASLESEGAGSYALSAIANYLLDAYLCFGAAAAVEWGASKMNHEDFSAGKFIRNVMILTTANLCLIYYSRIAMTYEVKKSNLREAIATEKTAERDRETKTNIEALVKILERAQLSPEDQNELEKIFSELTAQQPTNQ